MRIKVTEFDVTGAREGRVFINDRIREIHHKDPQAQDWWEAIKNEVCQTCMVVGLKAADIEFWSAPEEDGGKLLHFKKFVRANYASERNAYNKSKNKIDIGKIKLSVYEPPKPEPVYPVFRGEFEDDLAA